MWACATLGEGVALARAVESSKKIYMLAENYPYMAYNQEMRKLYKEGLIGDFKYGEGEYIHPDPADVKLRRSCGINHWRNWIPPTYYCTHAIAPVMFITTRVQSKSTVCRSLRLSRRNETMTAIRSDCLGVLVTDGQRCRR
jgi:predicted dehydrogenase